MAATLPEYEALDPSDLSQEIVTKILSSSMGKFHCFRYDRISSSINTYCWTEAPFLMFVIQGRIRIWNPANEQALWVGPGEAVNFAAHSYTNVDHPEDVTLLRVTFHTDCTFLGIETISGDEPLSNDAQASSKPRGKLRACLSDEPVPVALMKHLELFAEWHMHSSEDEPTGSALVRIFLWQISQWLKASNQTTKTTPEHVYRQILRFIHDHCHLLIGRDDIARAFKISPGHLSRIFKSHGDLSLQNALLESRLRLAQTLLRNSNNPIEEIAIQSGFTSRNYFTQAFKRHFQESPNQYRKRLA